MSIELNCTQCRAVNAFTDSQAGRKGRCGKCGTPLYIPTPDEMPAPGRGSLLAGRGRVFRFVLAAGVLVAAGGAAVGGYLLLYPATSDTQITDSGNEKKDNEPAAHSDEGDDFKSAASIKVSAAGAATHVGRFDHAKDVDMFRFKAAVSGTMVVTIEPVDEAKFDAQLFAYDSQNKELAQNDSDGDKRVPQVLFAVAADQEYYVKVGTFDEGTGPYRLSLATVTDVGETFETSLEVKLSRAGYARQAWKLDSLGDEDMFRMVPPKDGWMRVEMKPSGGSLMGALFFYNEAKQPLGEDNAGPARLEFSVSAGKTYYVKAAAWSLARDHEKVGSYILAFSIGPMPTDDYGNDFDKAHEITLTSQGGASVTGTIERETDLDFFRFKATHTGTMTADIKPIPPSILDGILEVYNDARKLIAKEGAKPGVVEWYGEKGKIYYLKAACFRSPDPKRRTGAYTITTRSSAAAAKTTVADDFGNDFSSAYELLLVGMSATVNGTIETIGDIDFFRFRPVTGGTVVINLTPMPGSKLDSYLAAYDENHSMLKDHDNGFASTLTLQVQANRTYYLKVQSSPASSVLDVNKTGGYTLTVRLEGPASKTLGDGTEQTRPRGERRPR